MNKTSIPSHQTMPNDLNVEHFQTLRKALDTLNGTQKRYHQHIDKAREHFVQWRDTHHNKNDDAYGRRFRVLLLQLRLDTQDNLAILLQFNKSLCLALGIDHLNDAERNLERLAYALGDNTLHLQLHVLSALIDSLNKSEAFNEKLHRAKAHEKRLLERILHRLKHKGEVDASFLEDGADLGEEAIEEDEAGEAVEKELKESIDVQECFREEVEQLTEAWQVYAGGIPRYGLIHDYHAGLKGPIDEFYQACLHGLGMVSYLEETLSAALGGHLHHIGAPEISETLRECSHHLIHATHTVGHGLHESAQHIHLLTHINHHVAHAPHQVHAPHLPYEIRHPPSHDAHPPHPAYSHQTHFNASPHRPSYAKLKAASHLRRTMQFFP